MLKEFKAFVMRGNVLDLAVAVVIGGAFGAIVKSLVDDLIMPLVGLLLGGMDFTNLFVVLKQGAKAAGPYATLATAKAGGAAVLSYGVFVQAIVNFLIISAAIFLVVRLIGKLQKAPATTTKECPFCLSTVPLAATRCPACTSEIEG
ncbi:MAG TPA: large conductance mechanosensitive channel protein MscL [Coriobacteriia bacterium]